MAETRATGPASLRRTAPQATNALAWARRSPPASADLTTEHKVVRPRGLSEAAIEAWLIESGFARRNRAGLEPTAEGHAVALALWP